MSVYDDNNTPKIHADDQSSKVSASILTDFLARPLLVRSITLSGIFIIMFIGALAYASAILIPITIAYILNLLLSPLVSRMLKWRIPAPISAGIVILIFLSITFFTAYSVIEPAEEWLTRAPKIMSEMKTRLNPVISPLTEVKDVADQVEKILGVEEQVPDLTKINVSVNSNGSRLANVMSSTSGFLAGLGIVLVLLYFLLASGDSFLNKLVAATPRFRDKKRAVAIIRDIQKDISHYLLTRTLINICLGVCITIALHFLGMPNPLLWGTLAAMLNFAPYIGPAVSLLTISTAAILSFDSISEAMLIPIVVLGMNIIEGELVSHQIIGKRLSLSPVVVFTGIVFWGWLWGIAGALMAIPIIAAINVVCQKIDSLKPISDFISAE